MCGSDKIKEAAEIMNRKLVQLIKNNEALQIENMLNFLKVIGTNDIVYVSDIETNEVIKMNSKAIEVFGNGVGKKCYEVFHHRTSPCDTCTNKKITINLDSPHKSFYYNQVSKELYDIVDVAKVIEGRLVRLEVASPMNGRTKEFARILEKFKDQLL